MPHVLDIPLSPHPIAPPLMVALHDAVTLVGGNPRGFNERYIIVPCEFINMGIIKF